MNMQGKGWDVKEGSSRRDLKERIGAEGHYY
jgi:hypothetical protein